MQPGWHVPVNIAVQQPDLLMHVPRKMAVLIVGLIAAFTLVLKQLLLIPILIGLWVAVAIAVKIDPDFFDIITRHINDADYLEP